MPSSLLSLDAFICEKVMVERDGVFSAIRIVEAFYYAVVPDIPIDRQGPSMFLFVNGKIPANDHEEHLVEFSLVRPNGDTKILDGPQKGKMTSSLPGFLGGFAVAIQVVVIPSQMGQHYFSIKFDGKEVRQVPFILMSPPLSTSAQ
jgi:hypothetical protein